MSRLSPQALLARGLADPASPAPRFAPLPTPTTPPVSPSGGASEPGTVAATLAGLFPEYRFDGVISRGGFGTVYRAEHRQMRRRVAVKILAGALTRDVSTVARFEREIAAIGKVDHPGIVRAFDAGERDGVWFLAMELVDGADFSTLSRALGPLPPTDACELIRQAALALHHAHERNLIHRDVKPSNMMLTPGPQGTPLVKVLDFGLAQLAQNENAGGELTHSGELLGTVDYIAPEQIENPRSVDARADVYGLGATLYRLLSGQAPHQAAESSSTLYAKLLRITREACPSIASRRPELSPGLVAVVDRMVARDPGQRFASADEVATALAPFAEGCNLAALLARVPAPQLTPLPSPSLVASPPTPPLGFGSRKRAIGFAVIAGVLLVVGMAIVWRRLAPKTDVSQATDALAAAQSLAGPLPEQIAKAAYDLLMVDEQTVPRILTPTWRYQRGIRLGTPRGAHFHPTNSLIYFCAGKGIEASICSWDSFNAFNRHITNAGDYTSALAPDGDTVVWSDRAQGSIGRGSLGTRSVTSTMPYSTAAAGASPMGLAFPPPGWAGGDFSPTDGVVADAGANGSKGLWRFSLDGKPARQLVANPEVLDEPVDVAFTHRDIYVVNRVRGRTTRGAAREDDSRRRLFRLQGDRLMPCLTDQPIFDPCGIAWDPRSWDFFVLCGRQLESEPSLHRLLRLRPSGGLDHFVVTEAITGLRRPTDPGVDISADGQSLVLTLEGGDAAFVCRFARNAP